MEGSAEARVYRETERLGRQSQLIKGLVSTQRTLSFISRVLEGSLCGFMKVNWGGGREGPKEPGTILRSPRGSVVSPPLTHLATSKLSLSYAGTSNPAQKSQSTEIPGRPL